MDDGTLATFSTSGYLTTQDLRERLGWRGMAAAVSSGLTMHPWRGVYVDGAADHLCRLLALQSSVGRQIVACHGTAALLHGFGVIDDGTLHVTTADGRSLRQRPGVLIHQTVPRSRLISHGGILLTGAADTAVDVAGSGREIDILAVLDAALRSGATTKPELLAATERARRRRGVVAVRRWADQADGLAESAMESRTRFQVLRAKLPTPELQLLVPVGAGRVRRLDLAWRGPKVGLEYDGEDFHSGDGSLRRDRQRHNELTEAGWTVLYATAADVYVNPEPLVAALRRLVD